MSRIVYVNGEFVPEEEAKVSVFDRGFLFADAVYEVTSVLRGRLIDNAAHLARLARSLDEIGLESPLPVADITAIQQELVDRNRLDEGVIYLQVSRGAADRDFVFPEDAEPTLVMFTQVKELENDPKARSGIRVISTPDIRWGRCDIKTTALLAACLAKQAASQAGVDDAWFVADGLVTEGSSNNAFILAPDGTLITRQLGSEILPGITRQVVLALCDETNLRFEERPFSLDEAWAASEAFVTSASSFVYPVVAIDGKAIGDGRPGPVATRLRELYIAKASAD
ncbi:MAG: D-amino-acid transaminase [Sphingomonadales bacterium]|nr:D-amino-acid transaminase [Sphingomonadales bacterium]